VSGQELKKIRSIADYQYGNGAGGVLFPDNIELVYSRKTGRVRHVKLNGELQATFRPNDGMLTLTIPAAQKLVDKLPFFGYTVTIDDDVAEFIIKGKNVFAKHVVDAGEKIRPGDEAIIINKNRRVLALGKALLVKSEMFSFKTGVAVKVRRGSEE
jgi:predicted RNA-binding protein (TIGR00451 family)